MKCDYTLHTVLQPGVVRLTHPLSYLCYFKYFGTLTDNFLVICLLFKICCIHKHVCNGSASFDPPTPARASPHTLYVPL